MKLRTHSLFVLSLLIMATLGAASSIPAQERQMGGAGITVFVDSNFRGKSATFQQDVADLKHTDFNDRISSLRVAPGEQWEVCADANYQGRCVVVTGDEADLKKNSWNDVISSFRRVGGGVAGPPIRPMPPWQGDWYIVLFDQSNYRGNPTNYKGPVPSLNRPVQSVTIGKGRWELCDGENFTGRCVTLDSSVPEFRNYGFKRVASLRPSGSNSGVHPVPPMPPSQGGWYIVLFDQPNYRGTPTNYNGPAAILNRRAQSVTIGKGMWELCEGARFTGRCVTLNQSTPDLSTYNLSNRVSSVRPVTPQPR